MGLMGLGREIQGSENTSPWMDQKRSSLTSRNDINNYRYYTVAVCMIVSEQAIINSTGRFNAPLDFWGCTDSPRYHTDRFHAYKKFPNKRDLYVAQQSKKSIQDYYQRTFMMGVIRGAQDSQGKWGHIASMEMRSVFLQWRVQLTRSWKEEIFGPIYHALLMCEMIDPYTSRSVHLSCVGSLKGEYERQNHKVQNEDQMVDPNSNEILHREGGSAQNTE